MNETIVAMYDDMAVVRRVFDNLVNADFEPSAISLITSDAQNQYSHYLDKDYVPGTMQLPPVRALVLVG